MKTAKYTSQRIPLLKVYTVQTSTTLFLTIVLKTQLMQELGMILFWSSGDDIIDGGSNDDTLELESNSFSDIISMNYDSTTNDYKIEFSNNTIQSLKYRKHH